MAIELTQLSEGSAMAIV